MYNVLVLGYIFLLTLCLYNCPSTEDLNPNSVTLEKVSAFR